MATSGAIRRIGCNIDFVDTDKNGNIDYNLLRADKTHDIPMFITRTEGAGRFQRTGRFTGAGVETEFIQPHFQAYNLLQRKLDPYANLIADVLSQKGLQENFTKQAVKINNKKQPSRTNPINKELLNKLDEYGYKPNLNKFNNQYEFIEEVSRVIDGIYKDRQIRTVVPVTKQGA